MKESFIRACVLAVVMLAVPCHAQEVHQLGLDFSVGSSSQTVGVTWHVARTVALRPTFNFSHTKTDSDTLSGPDGTVTQTNTAKTTNVGGGLEALAYLSRSEPLSTYLAGSYRYGHLSSSGGLLGSHANTAAASFGAQYAFNKRLSIYGETGISYTSSETAAQGLLGASRTHTVNTLNTNIGAIFYLK
jgi:predicted porin